MDPARNGPEVAETRDGETNAPPVARIDETACIGCALCLDACPVDAIVGAATRMHTVIAAECTGCGWCLPPCPVDCIELIPTGWHWTREDRKRRARQYRDRYRAREERLRRDHGERLAAASENTAQDRKQAAVARAMQRAAQRLRKSDP